MSRLEEQLKAQKLRQFQSAKAEMKAGLPHLYGFKHYKWSRSYFESTNRMNLLTAANQIGKALSDDTLIPTPTGFKLMGDLQVGDYVFASDGTATQVVAIPFKDVDECYRITFDDGSQVVASKNHRWVCKTSKQRFRRSYSVANGRTWANEDHDRWTEATTGQIILSGQYGPEAPRPWNRVSIPVCQPVQFPDIELFDPYLVGLLIGDGGLKYSVILTSADREIADYVTEKYNAKPTGKYGYRLNGLQPQMRDLGLFGKGSLEKFIPPDYLRGSRKDRLALLQGLMDTDGTIGGKCAMSFCTISERLKDNFVELVTSLGGKCVVSKKRSGYKTKDGFFVLCNDSYHIKINVPFCPFRLTRKAKKYYPIARRHERVIYKIEPVGQLPSTCITVAHPSGTFLCTKDYIVTHNSIVNWRKCIHWATDKKLWAKLWPRTPRVMWYLYPDKDTATTEWETKIRPELMPRGKFKDDPIYGWTEEYEQKHIKAIKFNSGVWVLFKTYTQQVKHLQAGSAWAIFGDEELPVELYPELKMRLSATKGYYHNVFTATLAQPMWWRAMEGEGDAELFPDAFKLQVSKYDCLYYDDGTPGPWTVEEIEAEERTLSAQEVQRRIHGKFVATEGRKYPTFEASRHMVKPVPVPTDWKLYAAVDVGSGGENHPGAMAFVCVSPDYKKGFVYKGKLCNEADTTAGDLLEVFIEKRDADKLMQQGADPRAKDFHVIAQRVFEPFIKAESKHDVGEDTINTLFKYDMLQIFDIEELQPLSTELSTLMKDTPKAKAKDDFCDALRYCVTMIPWDWSAVHIDPVEAQLTDAITPKAPKILTEAERLAQEIEERRGVFKKNEPQGWDELTEEFAFWNGCYGS